jgi:hypothetical protein
VKKSSTSGGFQKMSYTITMKIKGHIIDSLIFSKILDAVFETGAKCKIDEIKVGEEQTETSSATLTIEADNEDTLTMVPLNASLELI